MFFSIVVFISSLVFTYKNNPRHNLLFYQPTTFSHTRTLAYFLSLAASVVVNPESAEQLSDRCSCFCLQVGQETKEWMTQLAAHYIAFRRGWALFLYPRPSGSFDPPPGSTEREASHHNGSLSLCVTRRVSSVNVLRHVAAVWSLHCNAVLPPAELRRGDPASFALQG